jgi:hypothetical protein
MPTEVRRLVFANAEFYAALDQYLSRTGTNLPSGSIVKIHTDMIRDTITVDISRGTSAAVEAVTLTARQVGGALIGYCINNQIPLPRGFSKSLIVAGDNIALDMTNAMGELLLGIDRAHTVATID